MPDVMDMRGLACPLPVLKAHKAMRTLDAGRELILLSDDKKARQDFKEYCALTGHALVSCDFEDAAKAWRFVLRKKGD